MTTPKKVPFQQFSFTDWQKYYQLLATTELQQPIGSALLMSFGAVKDALADRVRISIKSKLPGSGFSSPDSLVQIGNERGIQRNPGESDSSFDRRLQNAWNVWPFAGTAQGVLRALYDAGYPNVAIVQQVGNFYTISVDSLNNTTLVVTASPRSFFDNKSPWLTPIAWPAFGILSAGTIVVPNPKNGFYYASSNPGTTSVTQPTWPTVIGATVLDGNVIWQCKGQDAWNRYAVIFFFPYISDWGFVPPANGSAEQIRISNLVRQWQSAHSVCVSILATAGSLWGYPAPQQGLTWANWRATWGSNIVAPTYWTP